MLDSFTYPCIVSHRSKGHEGGFEVLVRFWAPRLFLPSHAGVETRLSLALEPVAKVRGGAEIEQCFSEGLDAVGRETADALLLVVG